MADDAGKNVVTLGHWEALKRKQGKEQAVPMKVAKDSNELTRIKNPSGIVPSLDNAKRAIQRFGIKFRFNLFRQRVEIEGYEEGLGETLDDIELKVRDLVNEELGFDPEPKYTRDAIRVLAMQNAYDPVREYLDGLKWDGVKRLDTWLTDYLGANDDALTRAIGRAVLVAGVRRVRRPGCKFDFVMVLEGPQGGGKSTVLKVLAGGEEYFSDEIIVGEDYKAQQELLRGKWIVEVAELAGLSAAAVQKVKAFVSKTHDRARGAFQRSVEEAPRRCIMIGTTNDGQYLKDTTGNRRFWPVEVGRIDLAGLREVRDQLWAEAAAAEPSAADPITIPEELWGEAAKRVADRVTGDIWDEILGPEVVKAAKEVEGALRITAGTVFEKVLKMEPKLVRRQDTMRLADCMRRLGWVGPKAMRIDGALVKGYVREVDMARE